MWIGSQSVLDSLPCSQSFVSLLIGVLDWNGCATQFHTLVIPADFCLYWVFHSGMKQCWPLLCCPVVCRKTEKQAQNSRKCCLMFQQRSGWFHHQNLSGTSLLTDAVQNHLLLGDMKKTTLQSDQTSTFAPHLSAFMMKKQLYNHAEPDRSFICALIKKLKGAGGSSWGSDGF